MFKKSFAKYARIISDEKERQHMYSMHLWKTIFDYAHILLIIVDAVLSISMEYVTASSEGLTIVIAPVPVIFTGCWLAFFITFIALSIAFHRQYKDILFRPRAEGESEEMYSYRQKVQKEHRRKKVFKILSLVFIILGVGAVIAAITLDSIALNQGAESSSYTTIAIAVYITCFICGIILFLVPEMKSVLNDYDLDEETANEVRAIDEAQGRKMKITVAKDPEGERFKYMFPTKELYAQAEQMKKYRNKLSFITSLFVAVAYLIFCMLVYFGIIAKWNIWGFAMPIFMTIMGIVSAAITLSYNKKLEKLQCRQKEEIEGDEKYIDHIEIIDRVACATKRNNILMLISLIVSIIIGFVLAIMFPTEPYSTISITPCIIATIIYFISNHKLNKSIAPFKANIDAIK